MTPLSLNTLSAAPHSRKQRRRVGRGNGSRGTYSGRGAKGQRSRTGGTRGIIRRSMRTLMERVAKQRGFTSQVQKLAPVNVRDLERVFASGDTVTLSALVKHGLLKQTDRGAKVLGMGTLTKKLTVQAHGFSASARTAIENAGGKAVLLGQTPKPEATKKERPS